MSRSGLLSIGLRWRGCGRGSLLIDKIDQVPASLQDQLLELERCGQWCAAGTAQTFAGRLFFTAESSLPELDRCCTLIRMPPLRVRQRSRKLGWPVPPEVPEAVVKRLQSYDFPYNLRELELWVISRPAAGAPRGAGLACRAAR